MTGTVGGFFLIAVVIPIGLVRVALFARWLIDLGLDRLDLHSNNSPGAADTARGLTGGAISDARRD